MKIVMTIPAKNIVGKKSCFPKKSSAIPITKKKTANIVLCSLMKSEKEESFITGQAWKNEIDERNNDYHKVIQLPLYTKFPIH